MKPPRSRIALAILVVIAALLFSPAPMLAQEAAAAAPALTAAQMEAFLLNATIVSSRVLGKGVTGSRVATLSDGRLTHDAHVQFVNIEKRAERNFKDLYRYNIAAYRLARLLGLDNVPPSVERQVDRAPAAVTWWVDDVLMDEEERLAREKKKTAPKGWRPARIASYIDVMRVFDELIANADRNAGNQLWTNDGSLWLIDHTRAFRLQHRLRKPRLLERCTRPLWTSLHALTRESVTNAVAGTLTNDEIEATLARRDRIVKQFDELIEAKGDGAILYNPTP